MTAIDNRMKNPEKRVSNSSNNSSSQEPENQERRTVIRKLAVGTAALAGCSLLPEKWTTPILEFGALPAHATTSGTSAAASAAKSAAPAPPPAPAGVCSTDFNLIFLMTHQSCDSCGIWFDSAELVIVHTAGTYRHSQSGSLLIKKAPYRVGTFVANLGAIPCNAAIQNATLVMRLNRDEGIANSDSTSVIAVYDNSGGRKGAFVRNITAGGDIKGRGYSKANPNVPIDFTQYARQVHGQ